MSPGECRKNVKITHSVTLLPGMNSQNIKITHSVTMSPGVRREKMLKLHIL